MICSNTFNLLASRLKISIFTLSTNLQNLVRYMSNTTYCTVQHESPRQWLCYHCQLLWSLGHAIYLGIVIFLSQKVFNKNKLDRADIKLNSTSLDFSTPYKLRNCFGQLNFSWEIMRKLGFFLNGKSVVWHAHLSYTELKSSVGIWLLCHHTMCATHQRYNIMQLCLHQYTLLM